MTDSLVLLSQKHEACPESQCAGVPLVALDADHDHGS